MSLVRAIFWIALFVASTFCFLVLFDHGPTNFAENSKAEWAYLQKVFGLTDAKKKEIKEPGAK
jgi:hypothetical protein